MRSAFLAAAALATAPAVAKAPVLHVSGWVRPTVAGQSGSAGYLDIHNAGPGGDRLLAVSTPGASRVSLHSTSMSGGVMRMRAAGPQLIRQGAQLRMKAGGLHLMLTGLKAPLKAGGRLPMTLKFQRAGLVRASIPIQMSAADDGHSHH